MNILLTFDYELFFGSKVGSVQSCMLNPTEQIMRILDQSNTKATFYVDIGYLLRCQFLQRDLSSYELVSLEDTRFLPVHVIILIHSNLNIHFYSLWYHF